MKRSRTINRKCRFDCSRGGPEYSRWTESKRTFPLDFRRKCRSFWHNGAAQAALVSGIKSSRSLMLDDDITFGELSSVWAIPGLDNKKSEALRQLSVKARLSKLPKELFYFEFLRKRLLRNKRSEMKAQQPVKLAFPACYC